MPKFNKNYVRQFRLGQPANKGIDNNFLLREINPNYIGISFIKFVDRENNKNPLAARSYQELYAGNAPAYWLDFKIDYYYFCFKNNCLEAEKPNITKLI